MKTVWEALLKGTWATYGLGVTKKVIGNYNFGYSKKSKMQRNSEIKRFGR